ncbi:hypothetical protein Pfo_019600 [Paulownia fortunei]|nr:hypothetical protein Pfo_019600 [Paulownia fortunei]
MGSNTGVLCQKLASLIHTVSVYLLPLFSFISTYIFRLQRCGGSLKKNDKDIIFLEAERGPAPESEAEKDVTEFGHFDIDAEEEQKPELRLNFKFPTFDEFSRLQKRTDGKFVKVYEETGGVQGKGKVIVRFDGEENGKVEAMEFAEKTEEDEEFLDESQFFSEKNSDGFLSDGDFGGELDTDGENEKTGLESEISCFEENQESPEYFADEENEIMEEVKNLEEHNSQNPDKLSSDFLSERDFNENLDNKNDAEFVAKDDTGVRGGDNSEKPKPKDSSMSDSGDANKLESLWEHQELIEQLKMELRKVRATGLPTIIEESESPKISDDLKPWKIDDKFQHEDCMGELHKFYKSYTEMMRKFDILNYQKMYAMGFLQLKDPFKSTSQQKPSAPTLKSLVSQNLWLFKHKSRGSDPIKKFINELQGDLEVVYVGQMCLSWEFLHWQYEKALDLWNSDPHGVHRYNEVAGEFQQFQVLMQRFTEDEPFQGPRVQTYVKNRCVLRNLLQVPVIREDCLKDKNKARKKETDEYVVTSETIVETVEESIRIFWRFVRSDKDCTSVAINGHKKIPELHNPEDLKLLVEVRKILQKKERKLKDLLRSENCILRKFRQSREDDSDQVLYFFAQVDMKIVCRVLNMSKITREQLIWCRNKLSKINFVNRKIYVEPAFLLFPC